ncbi:1537_t:CDS:2 [Rhizophagus irregularis]|nr:1537_t:CDS:2 [Rhizophagus irregularis]
MSFLTKEQLASKNPKTTSLKSPTRPLSASAISSSSISTDERKVGALHGPRSPPTSKRSSLTATTSPRASVFSNNIMENNKNSSLNEIKPAPIIESTINDSISDNSSTKSTVTSNISNDEKRSNYKSNNNNIPSAKGADDPTKGSYVLSAAFKSSYSAASRTPSIKKPVIQPSPKQEQFEIASNKKQRDSTIQELQNRSDINWNAQPLTSLPSNNRQTIRPTSSLHCASCGKAISGHVLSAMGKKWHPDHFVCKKCGITLEHVAFFEKDGVPYCHLDFHELFSPKCGYCETPIEGQAINALGKSWHPEHFFCRECGNPFENGFMVHEGFPYCEKDWMKLFAPKCKGCNEGIRGEFMSALEGMWHRECFVCMTCKEPFFSSYYYVSEGKPYCDKHYRDLLSIN